MNTFVIRFLGLSAQIVTAFRLIKLYDLIEYGNYVVYVFEVNILSIFLSFGVITFNINNLAKNKHKEFYKNNAEVILWSLILLVIAFLYFAFKYQSIYIPFILLILTFLKVLQNICYSGILGEKGINKYNVFLNSQLIFFMLVTFIPNVSILNLLSAWVILTFLNVLTLRKYVLNSLKFISIKQISFSDFKIIANRSIYDFNNNFINRYEIIILSFFEKYAAIVGLLSVFMQIGDSLINFFKTLAPKIQMVALTDSKSTKKLHLVTVLFFSAVVVFLLFTYKFWMKYLKPELLSKQFEYGLWSLIIILSIILWSYRYELQSKSFNIIQYNSINIFFIILVSILSTIFAENYYALIVVRFILLVVLIKYTYNLIRRNIE